jgi:hypothetical protein
MKQVGIRDFQINLTTLLKEVPFIVTKYGKPIAIVKNYNIAMRSDDRRLKPENLTVNKVEGRTMSTCKVKGCSYLVVNGVCLSKAAHRQ